MRALEGRGAFSLASGREWIWWEGRNKHATRGATLIYMKNR